MKFLNYFIHWALIIILFIAIYIGYTHTRDNGYLFKYGIEPKYHAVKTFELALEKVARKYVYEKLEVTEKPYFRPISISALKVVKTKSSDQYALTIRYEDENNFGERNSHVETYYFDNKYFQIIRITKYF
jgi:preprotein translocase subunit SecF